MVLITRSRSNQTHHYIKIDARYVKELRWTGSIPVRIIWIFEELGWNLTLLRLKIYYYPEVDWIQTRCSESIQLDSMSHFRFLINSIVSPSRLLIGLENIWCKWVYTKHPPYCWTMFLRSNLSIMLFKLFIEKQKDD